MDPASLVIGLVGLSPLASEFGELSRFLYKVARDKGEIREEIETFALIIKVTGDSLFVTSKKLGRLPPSVRSSDTCQYLEKQRTLQDVNKAIRKMRKTVAAIFPKLDGMTKKMGFRSKFRWVAKQKQRLAELTQNIVPLQLGFGLIVDVIGLERDHSDKACTNDPVFLRRLDEHMENLNLRLEMMEEQLTALKDSQGSRNSHNAKSRIFLSRSSIRSLVKLSSSMRVDGRVPETFAGPSNGTDPRTTPSLTWSSTRADSSMSNGNFEQDHPRSRETKTRRSRIVARSTMARDLQGQQTERRGRSSSVSMRTASNDSGPRSSAGRRFPSTSPSPNRLNGRQDVALRKANDQEEVSDIPRIIIDVNDGIPTCSTGQIRPLNLVLRFPSAAPEAVSVSATLCSTLLYDYMSSGMARSYNVDILPVDESVLVEYKIEPGLRTEVTGLTEPIYVGLYGAHAVQFVVFNSSRHYLAVGSSTASRQKQWHGTLDSE